MTIARYKLLGWTILFAVAGLALRSGVFGANSQWGFILGVVIMLGLLAFAVADWRLMDEVSREACKTAALWGPAIGLVLWAIAMSALGFGLGPNYGLSVWGHRGSLAIFLLGGLAVIIAQGVCFLLGLAGWWISKR